jgi:Cof subfamily protein (haloacid dehalogenase superfamily)
MTYRLIALDLDGTALDSNRAIRPATKEALAEAQKRGIKVVLVTGRHHVATHPYHHELGLPTPAVCCNGTYLYDYGRAEVLRGAPLRKEQARSLLTHCRREGVHTLIYSGHAMNFEVQNDHLTGLIDWANQYPAAIRPVLRLIPSFDRLIDDEAILWKFVISHDDRAVVERCVAAMGAELDLSYEWSWIDRVDVAQSGNSKGARLAEWAKSQDIRLDEIIAFGDNLNDISMLKLAGLGVAMGNGEAEVKDIADLVTTTNDTDGIAETLGKFVL